MIRNSIGNGYAHEVMQRVQARSELNVDERILDMDTLAQAILEAEGDMAFVAEKLLGNKRRQDELLAALSADPQSFSAFALKTRAFVLIKLIQCYSILGKATMANVHNLEPEAAAKLFLKSAEMAALLTKADTAGGVQNTQINVFDTVLKTMPQPVADIMRRMLEAGVQTEDGDVITVDPINLDIDTDENT